jgi:hypothetical protein
MYAAYLYILRAFDGAAGSRLDRSLDPEREIADGRWPSAAVKPVRLALTGAPGLSGNRPWAR